jgi:CRP/FNR family transcriptional regulator, nitrogen fixation regulation protein
MQLATPSSHSVPYISAYGHPQFAMESLGTLHRYDTGETVYCQGGAADHWYRIVGGAARKSTQIADGRRHIMDFLLPGDLFGFDAAARHECSVECVAPSSSVVHYQRKRMESLMESDPDLARRIRQIAFDSIDRLQSRMILLGHSRALERVCGFLLEMAHRAQIGAGETIALPMSRYDIADYLAIAVETVSRSLTTLRTERVIAFFDTRHFRIVDRSALEAHCCR